MKLEDKSWAPTEGLDFYDIIGTHIHRTKIKVTHKHLLCIKYSKTINAHCVENVCLF